MAYLEQDKKNLRRKNSNRNELKYGLKIILNLYLTTLGNHNLPSNL